MKEFTKGALFAAGVTLLGRGMYELGKIHEQTEEAKRTKAVKIAVSEMSKNQKETES